VLGLVEDPYLSAPSPAQQQAVAALSPPEEPAASAGASEADLSPDALAALVLDETTEATGAQTASAVSPGEAEVAVTPSVTAGSSADISIDLNAPLAFPIDSLIDQWNAAAAQFALWR
jgi:hypothetical protein